MSEHITLREYLANDPDYADVHILDENTTVWDDVEEGQYVIQKWFFAIGDIHSPTAQNWFEEPEQTASLSYETFKKLVPFASKHR